MTNPREALDELLNSLGESSQFVTSGRLTPVLPGLECIGVGSIGCPVSAADAKRLIAVAGQAPYGHGEETIVDTDVRRVWQIEPSKLVLRNPEWKAHVDSIVDAVRKDFGIEQKVTSELYKLLVYEKGSFFAPHRDTEKSAGMFATLVVCLPSRHEGGTLIVTHDGQTKRFDFGGTDSEFKTQYAAFYADCQHEITPVTDGYRICLVYNLAIAGKKPEQPSAPRFSGASEQAAHLLKDLFATEADSLNKIAIPFEHQYTEAGVDPRQLKGADRARFDVLVRAAESLDYQCFVALLTLYQSGEVDYSSIDYDTYRSRRRSYGWSRYEDEDDDSGDSGEEMGEIHEQEITLEHWLDPQGRKQPFGKMQVEENELLSPEGREEWSRSQEIHEATGNAGASMDRWYRQGVVVIWPRDRYYRILASEGQESAVPALEKMAARAKRPAAIQECHTFAAEIISHWKPRGYALQETFTARMLKLLERIGDVALVQRFLRDVLPKDFDGSEGKSLGRLFKRLGWEVFADDLRYFIGLQKPADPFTELSHIVSICESLCCDAPAMTQERRAVCVSLADPLAQIIQNWDTQSKVPWHRHAEKRTGVVAKVFHLFAAISATEHLDHFLAHVFADPKRYHVRDVLVPDVKAIFEWIAEAPAVKPAATRLWEHCRSELRTATATPIEMPRNWAREANLSCPCADCAALARFLRDPSQQVARFPLRKERRQHLHQEIDKHRCDCTHTTHRAGSPQTLVCTKTQASYEQRKEQYDGDQQRLAELEVLAPITASTAVRRTLPRKRKTGKRTPS